MVVRRDPHGLCRESVDRAYEMGAGDELMWLRLRARGHGPRLISETRAWGWLLASGLCDLVVAALIIAGFPGTAAWAIGLLVGINMIFGGTSLIIVALSARSSIQAEANTATGAAYPR